MDELIKEWIAEIDRQNELLVESGEEPITLEEFVSCRVDDVRDVRATQRAEHGREWWATYRAALSGNCAFSDPEGGLATEQAHIEAVAAADMAHGPLEQKS